MKSDVPTSDLPSLPRLLIDRAHLRTKVALAPQHRLTLIAAPAGFGKTTLVAQYTYQSTYPVLWQRLDRTERDAIALFEHSRAVFSRLLPDIAAIEPPAGASSGDLALEMSEALKTLLKQDIVYVIDDVHLLIDSPSAEQWLRMFIATMPSRCHLILVGRALPQIDLAEMIVRREVMAIGQDQLSFSFEEVNELAALTGLGLTPQEITKIYTRFAGWVAGIVLALQPLPSDLDTILSAISGGPERLFDTLADALLRTQPAILIEFLLYSSTLRVMTPSLCQNVLGIANSITLLQQASNRQLFISQQRGGMVYHPLFRDFLQRHFHQHNPTLFAQLHAQAGHWFAAEHQIPDAFDHYIASGLYEEAATLAEQVAQSYFARGQSETLLDWKAQLDATGASAPRLAFTCGMIYRDRLAYELAQQAFAQAEAGYHAQNHTVGLLQVRLAEATIANQRGAYRDAIQKAEPYLEDTTVPPNLRGYALSIVGTALLYLGDTEKAIQHLKTALPLWRDHGDSFTIGHLLVTLELAYLRLGRFDEAMNYLHEVVAIRRKFGGSIGIAMALNNLGYHQHLLGDYDQAYVTLQEALHVSHRALENRSEGYILSSLGDVQRDRGAFSDAETFYQRGLQLVADGDPSLRCHLLVGLATLKRWQGHVGEALTLATEAHDLATTYQLPLETFDAATSSIATQLAQPEAFEDAQVSLSEVVAALRRQASPIHLCKALGLSAYAALLANRPADAHRCLINTLQESVHPANLQPLIVEIAQLPLLETFIRTYPDRFSVLQQGVERLRAAQKASSSSETPPSLSDVPPTLSLRVHAFGHERFERDGKPVLVTAWQAASARELFFYLLFKGPASREQIGVDFWSDASPIQVRQKFHTTLRRVRDAIGANVIRFEDDRYYIDTSIALWCDVFEFEAAVKQAQLSSPYLAHTEMLWQRAVALYSGDFLVAFDSVWVTNYRMLLQQTYLDALLALANCLRIRGAVQDAIETLSQALTFDPYREDIHRALLLCYAEGADRTLVFRHAEQLASLLENDLGIQPSLETKLLVNNLLL